MRPRHFFDVVTALEEKRHLSPQSKDQLSLTDTWLEPGRKMPSFLNSTEPQGMCRSSVGVIVWVSCFSVIWAAFAEGEERQSVNAVHLP